MTPTPAAAPRPRGRRPAGEDTRATILAAARAEFAARGYEGTTLRGVARVAGVDARLVHHYFDGKDELFTAALELPVRPSDVVARVVADGPDGVGERLLRTFLSVWDSPEGRTRIVALASSVLTSESAARAVREFLTREILGRVAGVVTADRPEFRASLVASQMMGLIMVRYVVGVEPLASAPPDDVVAAIAPTVQGYLTGPLRPDA